MQAGTSRWTAILTIVTKAPATTDVLRKNPLGIYVDAIDWSRELDSDARPVPFRPPARPGEALSSQFPPALAASNLQNSQEIQP